MQTLWFRDRGLFRFHKFFSIPITEKIYPKKEKILIRKGEVTSEEVFVYYPSIGNRDYIYNEGPNWEMKDPIFIFNFLVKYEEAYNHICRNLRNVYYWLPQDVDEIPLNRLMQIYKETQEDHRKKKEDEL